MRTFDEYQQFCLTKRSPGLKTIQEVALGLCSEAGEVADVVKKAAEHGHAPAYGKLALELGDALYYIAVLASDIGLTLGQVATLNSDKLEIRHPSGFQPSSTEEDLELRIAWAEVEAEDELYL